MTDPPRYACIQCVATFDVSGHERRPDLAVKHCPYCGNAGVLDREEEANERGAVTAP